MVETSAASSEQSVSDIILASVRNDDVKTARWKTLLPGHLSNPPKVWDLIVFPRFFVTAAVEQKPEKRTEIVDTLRTMDGHNIHTMILARNIENEISAAEAAKAKEIAREAQRKVTKAERSSATGSSQRDEAIRRGLIKPRGSVTAHL